jgi:hypothetical protein
MVAAVFLISSPLDHHVPCAPTAPICSSFATSECTTLKHFFTYLYLNEQLQSRVGDLLIYAVENMCAQFIVWNLVHLYQQLRCIATLILTFHFIFVILFTSALLIR